MKFLLLILVGGVAALVGAAPVSVEWEALEGVTRYEFALLPLAGEEKSFKFAAKVRQWRDDLPPGIYSYRLRGWDVFKRPGEWSGTERIVTTASPHLLSPKDSAVVPLGKVKLEWSPSPGCPHYAVSFSGSAAHSLDQQQVSKTSIEVGPLPPGKYGWKVSCLFKEAPRFSGKPEAGRWFGAMSRERKFTVPAPENVPEKTPGATNEASRQIASVTSNRRPGQFRVSGKWFTDNYAVSLGGPGGAGRAEYSGVGAEIVGAAPIAGNLGVRLSAACDFFRVNQLSFRRWAVNLGPTLEFPLGFTRNRVAVHLGLGALARSWYEFTPVTGNTAVAVAHNGVLGLSPRLALDWQLSQSVGLSLQVLAFYPLSLIGTSAPYALGGPAISGNLTPSLEMRVGLPQSWFATIVAEWDRRQTLYTINGGGEQSVTTRALTLRAGLGLNW